MRRILLLAGMATGLGGCVSVSPGYYGQPALLAYPTEAWAPPVVVPAWAYPTSYAVWGPSYGFTYGWGAGWWGWRRAAWWGPPAYYSWARWAPPPVWGPRPLYAPRYAYGPRYVYAPRYAWRGPRRW